MDKKIKLLIWLILPMIYSCSGESSKLPDQMISVKISPAKKIIVESSGSEVSFSISPTPKTISLAFASSVNWIQQVAEKEFTWHIGPNTDEISRNGKIYILNADSYAHIDTISVVQKSVSGEISEDPALTFTEDDVPVKIPFRGNSYVTYPEKSSFIDYSTGLFSSTWNDNNIVISGYFYVTKPGEMKLAFVGNNATGTSKIRFTVDGKPYDVTVSGPTAKVYSIAKINRVKEGYVRIDMQGLSRTGNSFGEISYYRIGGVASAGPNFFVTDEKMNEKPTNCYFFRRGASVHYFYTLPAGNIEYFYNEVKVTSKNAVDGTYFMMNGFSEGYMGIQQTTSGERKILFSVWSPYTTDNASEIPKDQRVTLLRKGKNVTTGDFGGEGSGGQSWLNYSWSPDVVYKALVGVKPDGQGNTIYTAYFYADNEWKLIASFSRPKTSAYYTGAYSFLENFDPVQSYITRSVSFGNQWAYTASGEWKEVTTAKFSCDDTGRQELRYDIFGKTDQATNCFVLQSFGFFDEHTNYGTVMQRESSTDKKPVVDFSALERIPDGN